MVSSHVHYRMYTMPFCLSPGDYTHTPGKSLSDVQPAASVWGSSPPTRSLSPPPTFPPSSSSWDYSVQPLTATQTQAGRTFLSSPCFIGSFLLRSRRLFSSADNVTFGFHWEVVMWRGRIIEMIPGRAFSAVIMGRFSGRERSTQSNLNHSLKQQIATVYAHMLCEWEKLFKEVKHVL